MSADSIASHVIILAAGKSFQLDGINKALIRHPVTGKTILDYAIAAFKNKKITVVVGFKAVQLMQAYPQLNYIYNPDWALTNNAMSLALALNDEPTYIFSGDIFISPELIERLDKISGNLVLTSNREKRSLTAIHCVLDEDNIINDTYQGPVKNIEHPEAIGLFKINSDEVLYQWKRRCYKHGNLFSGQLLPCEYAEIKAVELQSELFFEINTPSDYINFINESKI